MKDATSMCKKWTPRASNSRKSGGHGRLQRPIAQQFFAECPVFGVFHHQEWNVLATPGVVRSDDVWMAQTGCGFDLLFEIGQRRRGSRPVLPGNILTATSLLRL